VFNNGHRRIKIITLKMKRSFEKRNTSCFMIAPAGYGKMKKSL
jgi:hypothetical protein